jgi:hypothetical protein
MFELVPFPSVEFQTHLALLCTFDLLLCIACERICLLVFTARNKAASKDLVDRETLTALRSYKRHNDDLLPEENHSFGVMELFRQNMALQRKMILRKHEIEAKERLNNRKKKALYPRPI